MRSRRAYVALRRLVGRWLVVLVLVAALGGELVGCAGPVPRPDGVPDPDLVRELADTPRLEVPAAGEPAGGLPGVNAFWDTALLRQATPPAARPRPVRAAAAGPPRPLLVLAPRAATIPSPAAGAGVGRLFFTMDGVPRSCTAVVVAAVSGSVVATAGHCLVSDLLSDAGSGERQRAENLLFVPGFRDGADPAGRWFGVQAVVADGWAQRGDWAQDVGFVRLSESVDGGTVQAAVGGLGLVVDEPGNSMAAVVTGYPATGRFDGSRAVTCTGPGVGPPDAADPRALVVACDMTPGYSGAPWTSPARPGYLLGVASHDYGGGFLYGARLGVEALAALRAVDQ